MDFSGWESPLNIIQTQISMEIEGEIMRAVQNVGVIVDKEELVKAIQYDRGQYNKGFENGYNKAIDDYMNKLCNHCMQQTNECYMLECPFCTDGCNIVNIAEKLKAGESE